MNFLSQQSATSTVIIEINDLSQSKVDLEFESALNGLLPYNDNVLMVDGVGNALRSLMKVDVVKFSQSEAIVITSWGLILWVVLFLKSGK